MKSDIDSLMKQRNFSAIIVFGNAEFNPPMTYLTNGGHVSAAILIKKLNTEPVIFCNGMEREEAAKSKLKVRVFDEFPYQDLLKEADGDPSLASALRLKNILIEMEINGRVGIYGQTDLSSLFSQLSHLQKIMPTLKLVGEPRENSLFMTAMETKTTEEVARIRKMGQITTEVVGLTAEYLQNCDYTTDGILINEDGSPLKLGIVKNKINLWLAERNVTPSEGFIFSLGRDAGVPHSVGNPEDLMRLGQTIVFDIYPEEAGGGYFYDFTRTWSMGFATPEAQKIYNQVHSAYKKIVENLVAGQPFKVYQNMLCELFEKDGHATPRTTKAPVEGYVHSIGHGVGLYIHERPFSGLASPDDNVLKPGVVFTIEPGLYYPDKQMGFRIEDTYWVNQDGAIELLAKYPYDFVLKMKKK